MICEKKIVDISDDGLKYKRYEFSLSEVTGDEELERILGVMRRGGKPWRRHNYTPELALGPKRIFHFFFIVPDNELTSTYLALAGTPLDTYDDVVKFDIWWDGLNG